MRRLVCSGCGLTENLDQPTGAIHPVQLVDLAETTYDLERDSPDKTVQEDLCKACRARIRREFFGIIEAELLEMPLMRGGA